MSFPTFARNLLFSALSTLRIGMELLQQEHVAIDCLYGHGGLFKAAEAGSRMMAAATGSPVTVMQTADVGGPWGMALLALYLLEGGGKPLADWLDEAVFAATEKTTTPPDKTDRADFDRYLVRYKAALGLEKAAEALLYGEE